ncbi:MAG: hypothetical protein IT429_25685 [Gemmataceae bacterium]|nr:hypothetical protein [Gemmataceae bacterium]
MLDQVLSTMNVVFAAKGMEEIGAAIDGALAGLQGLRDAFSAAGATAAASIGTQAGTAMAEVQDALGGVQDALGDTRTHTSSLQNDLDAVGDAARGALAGEGSASGRALGAVLAALRDGTEQYRALVEKLGKQLQEWLGVKGTRAARDMGEEQHKSGEKTKGLDRDLKGLQGTLQQVAQGVQHLGTLTVVSLGFQAARAVEGYVRAGLGASAVGQTLQLQFQQLNAVVAGLFGPELRKLVEVVGQVVEKLRSLTDAQRENVARWVMAGAAALTVVAIAPRVISAIGGVITSMYSLATATGIASGGILPLLGGIATAVVALGAGTEVGRQGFLGLWESARPLLTQLWEVVEQLGTAFEPVAAFAQEAFRAVLAAVGALLPTLMQMARTVGAALRGAFAGIAPLMLTLAGTWSQMVQALAPLGTVIADIYAALVRCITPLIQFYLAVQVAVAGVVSYLLSAFVPAVASVMSYAVPVIDGITYGFKVLGGAIIVVGEMLQQVGQEIVRFALAIYESVLSAVQALFEGIAAEAGGLLGFFQQIAQALAAVFGPVVQFIGEVFDKLAKKFDATIAKLSKPLPKLDMPKKGDGGQRGELPRAAGGFEGVESHWERLAKASIMATAGVRSSEDKMIELGEKQLQEQKEIKKAIAGQKPAVK